MERKQAPALDPAIIQQVLLGGDLSKLTPEHRIAFYNRVCESVGLNPLTKPFAYLRLSGKEVLYATKDCTEQLRFLHSISIDPKGFTREVIEGVYVVTAPAAMPSGRTDVSTGAVPIDGLKGEARANAMMKAETKAKRRVTLSICGLGMLDETEIESIPNAQTVPPLVIEPAPSRPEPPSGYVYVDRVTIERKGKFEWADVLLSTGEPVLAKGQQLVALLEQMAQEQVPVAITTSQTSKGYTQIETAERWKPEQPEEPKQPELEQAPF